VMRPTMNMQFSCPAVGRCSGHGWRTILVAALTLAVLASLACCDKATKHKPVKHNIYFGGMHISAYTGDSTYGWIYVYDADSLSLIDSISLNLLDPTPRAFTDELAVSPDGRWLYVLAASEYTMPSTLWKIDARTKQAVWSRSGFDDMKWLPIRVLQNGALLLVGDTVFRAEDGSVVRTLPDSLLTLWGPVSGTKVAAIVRSGPQTENGSIVGAIDVVTGELSGRYVGHLASDVPFQRITTARLHPDGRRVLAVGVYGSYYNCWFVVGDMETGQTLFQHRINYPFGDIAISNDGLRAAVTDPGAASRGELGRVYVVDLQTLSVTIPNPPAALLHWNWAAQICFLPGDRRVVTAAKSSWDLNVAPMSTIDLTAMRFEKSVWLPDSIGMRTGAIGVGPRP
jgi:hypothetical protein